jgi:hypothetical protein
LWSSLWMKVECYLLRQCCMQLVNALSHEAAPLVAIRHWL